MQASSFTSGSASAQCHRHLSEAQKVGSSNRRLLGQLDGTQLKLMELKGRVTPEVRDLMTSVLKREIPMRRFAGTKIDKI